MKLYWHIWHHSLISAHRDDITLRRKDIQNNKPVDEIETRLRLLQPVKGKLPLDIAGSIFLSGSRGLTRKQLTVVNKLHKKECKHCPWNGRTIFPGRRGRH